MKVSLIATVLNADEHVGAFLASIEIQTRRPDQVIVVDGGSTDGTVDVARAARPDIRIVRQPGHGKGDALVAGLTACTGDAVVMIDADGSTDGREIPRFVDALMEGAAFVKGSRFLQGGGSADISPLRRAGNRGFCVLVNRIYGTQYSDLCYGFNAGWRGSLANLSLDCDGFEVETIFSIRSAKTGLRVTEVPSFELPRLHGQSNLKPMRDGWRVLKAILRERSVVIASTTTKEANGPQPAALNKP
jgi:glycosyltransferase involved in cell wall biosynthesis